MKTSKQHIALLGEQLERHRLLQNIPQTELAKKAGISTRTLRRIESGQGGSLDSFVRLLMALNIDGNLSVLIPDSSVRPMERTRKTQAERLRASRTKKSGHGGTPSKTSNKPTTTQTSPRESNWTWGDEEL